MYEYFNTPSKHFEIHFYSYLCYSGILIALAHTLIALDHLNSTEKLHRLYNQERSAPTSYHKAKMNTLYVDEPK